MDKENKMKGDWKNCEDELPPATDYVFSDQVLIWALYEDGEPFFELAQYNHKRGAWYSEKSPNLITEDVLFWMPMPEPPAGEHRDALAVKILAASGLDVTQAPVDRHVFRQMVTELQRRAPCCRSSAQLVITRTISLAGGEVAKWDGRRGDWNVGRKPWNLK
jgi:hypothetical protein